MIIANFIYYPTFGLAKLNSKTLVKYVIGLNDFKISSKNNERLATRFQEVNLKDLDTLFPSLSYITRTLQQIACIFSGIYLLVDGQQHSIVANFSDV